ncbi:hypothetical protein [Streptomyces sp. CAU 1734]|uniref:hypothetical protein n=1 Tax=Streptomyces sp. CAU 1734 TaxID=3140360 RepID=UPI003260A293
MIKRFGYAVPVLVSAAAVILSGCSASDAGRPGSAPPAGKTPGATASPSGRTIPFTLSTHCGIEEALVGETYFEAVKPLDDGSGNPPAGWDNPSQQGRMTLVSPEKAVFTDDAGHEVVFRARPGAKDFKNICA